VKFFPLVWAGIWRKRSRAILILAQVIIAFTLFGVLQGLSSAVRHVIDMSHADRLYVGSRLRFGTPLPISIVPRVQETPGVIAASYRFAFGGSYQKPNQNVPILATDIEPWLVTYPEMKVDPAQVQAMKQTRDGALVGSETMSKYGWKVGQRVTFQTGLPHKNGSRDWTFQIVGVWRNTDMADQAVPLLVNYRYINEALAGQTDTIAVATLRIADPKQAERVEQLIDSQFANSSNETLTESEQELAQSQLENIGDLDVVVHRITAATFFVLLFATGALMMQSIRERTPELAVLKTFGFSDPLVMVLILCETLTLCLAGAALGLWLASVLFKLASSLVGLSQIPLIVVGAGFVCAVVLALAGGAIPAWRGLRLRVVDALANR
jgi:putative ABC transport system permease protein